MLPPKLKRCAGDGEDAPPVVLAKDSPLPAPPAPAPVPAPAGFPIPAPVDPKLNSEGALLPAGAGSDPDPKLNFGVELLVFPAGGSRDSDPDPKSNLGLALFRAGAGREPEPKLNEGDGAWVALAADGAGAVGPDVVPLPLLLLMTLRLLPPNLKPPVPAGVAVAADPANATPPEPAPVK